MKYIKIIVGLGLIALGAFIGSHISIGGGSAALLGGIAGAILYCVLDWFASRRHIRFWPSSSHLNEQFQVNNGVDQPIDAVAGKLKEMSQEEFFRLPRR